MAIFDVHFAVRKDHQQKSLGYRIEGTTPEERGSSLAGILIKIHKQLETFAKGEFGSAGHLEFVLGVQERLYIAAKRDNGPRLEACPNEYCSISRWKTKEVGIPCHVCGATNPGDTLRRR